MKTLIFLLFNIHLSFASISQQNNDSLIMKKWYFCDTNFYYGETSLLLLKNDPHYCENPENYKNGMFEIKINGAFYLENRLPCGPPIPVENGFIINGCFSQIEGNYKLEKNIIWIDGNKYNIDVLDEKYLLLRLEA
jgi:hypothetical protein